MDDEIEHKKIQNRAYRDAQDYMSNVQDRMRSTTAKSSKNVTIAHKAYVAFVLAMLFLRMIL